MNEWMNEWMKLSVFVWAKKLEKFILYTAPNQELKPMIRVETENGSISRESQFGVFMVRDLWRKGFIEKVRLRLGQKSEGVMDRKVEKSKMGWDKQRQVNFFLFIYW